MKITEELINNNNGLENKLVIVADTREQAPYMFKSNTVTTIHNVLPVGDYSVAGYEYDVAVERKSLNDFIHSITHARDRFFREIEKMAKFESACVVVEASIDDILGRKYRSEVHPKAVLGTVMSIIVDYAVPVFFCGGRTTAKLFVELYLTRWKLVKNRRMQNDGNC